MKKFMGNIKRKRFGNGKSSIQHESRLESRLLMLGRHTLSNMFFWFGIQLFDSRLKEYGGFNHFIAGKIFRWKFCYLSISLRKQWSFEWIHESDDYYYDGYHNSITIGCLQISYGT